MNSSFFGVPRHVTNPSHAVMLLGLDIVRGLVLAVGLFSKFDSRRLSGLGMETVYAHSMKVGALARELAKGENLEKQTVDNTFMAGLLHDLGKLVFATNFPEAYREVFALSRGGVAFHEAETEKLGASHAEVGAYLVSLWGLPDTIVEGLAFHHNPAAVSTIGFTPLIAVYAANILEHQTRSAAGGEAPGQGLDAGYLKRIGLGERAPAWIDLSRRME